MNKIMYFMDFPLSIGGANKVLLTQANVMQQRGYKVFVVIPNDQNDFHIPEYDQICKSYKLNTITMQFPIATCMEQIEIVEVIEKYAEIKKVISEYRPDLIHSVQLNITVELVARELKIPHLMSIYQTDEQEFLIDWMNVYPQYHSADSHLFSNRWGKGLGIMSECIRVAYEEKGNQIKPSKKKKVEPVNIVSIGVLCERKNQLEIIKFVLKCKNDGQKVKLTILGDYSRDYGSNCIKYVRESGLQEEVFFFRFCYECGRLFRKS